MKKIIQNNKKIEVKVLIMCGGKGTRMWPISNLGHPKQFEGLLGKKSMFAQTVNRVLKAFAPKDIYIATHRNFSKQLKAQAPQIPNKNLILEPALSAKILPDCKQQLLWLPR